MRRPGWPVWARTLLTDGLVALGLALLACALVVMTADTAPTFIYAGF